MGGEIESGTGMEGNQNPNMGILWDCLWQAAKLFRLR